MITQNWTPDTHPEITFVHEINGDTITCIGFIQKGALTAKSGKFDNLNPKQAEYYSQLKKVEDDALVDGTYANVLGLNVHKNVVVIPALLEALPDDMKADVLDEDGNKVGEEFKIRPELKVVDGAIVSDFSHIKDENVKAELEAILKINKVPGG